MYSTNIYKQAIVLRKLGKTYPEISTILGVRIPKSTLSAWTNNTELTSKERDRLKKNNLKRLQNARVSALAAKKLNRKHLIENLRGKISSIVENISTDIQKLLLSILYLAEGSKNKSSHFLGLANSDEKIIAFYLATLRSCFYIDERKFRLRVQRRADQDIEEVNTYWQKITGIPTTQFYKSYMDKRTRGSVTTHKNYHGVCTIYYFDTAIQLELELLSDSVIKSVLIQLGR
jgi:hypothetical protein